MSPRSTEKIRFRSPRIAAVAAMMAGTVALSGCLGATGGAAEAPESSDVIGGEVEWWTINLQANFGDYIQGLIDEYEEANPEVTIKWVDVPGADIGTKLLASLAAGNPPDLVNISSQSLGSFQPSLTDLYDYLSESDLAAYQESLVEPLVHDGALTALPWYNGGSPVVLINSDFVAGTSYDASAPPATYPEALELAQEIYDTHGVYGTNAMPGYTVMPYYGVEMLNEDGTEAAFNTPETVDVLEEWKQYYDSGAIAPGAVAKDERNLPENLENGRVGMLLNQNASWLNNTKENAPQIYEKVVVQPGLKSDEGLMYLNGQQTFGIPSKSDNKATAADWLLFVTNAQNQLEFCEIVAIYPSTKETLEDPFFQTAGDTPIDKAREAVIDNLGVLADGALGTSNDLQLGELFNEQIRAFLAGAVDAQTALSTAEEQWNAELAQ